jgi:hypothetical protein
MPQTAFVPCDGRSGCVFHVEHLARVVRVWRAYRAGWVIFSRR